jgi:hypothetical protein
VLIYEVLKALFFCTPEQFTTENNLASKSSYSIRNVIQNFKLAIIYLTACWLQSFQISTKKVNSFTAAAADAAAFPDTTRQF